MNVTLNELMQGKGYKRGASIYPDTEAIVTPFMQAVEPFVSDWAISVQTPNDAAVDLIANGEMEEVEEYKIYSRVLMEGILKPEYQLTLGADDHYTKTIGFLYALDTQNPVAKCYSGWLRRACTNLAVFNPNGIVTKNFSASDFQGIYESPLQFIDQAGQEAIEFQEKAEGLMVDQFSGEGLKNLLGHLAIHCIAKNTGMGTAYANLVKMLSSNRDIGDVKNIYYRKEGAYSKYDLYQGLTGTLSLKSDIIAKPDAIYKAFKIFSN